MKSSVAKCCCKSVHSAASIRFCLRFYAFSFGNGKMEFNKSVVLVRRFSASKCASAKAKSKIILRLMRCKYLAHFSPLALPHSPLILLPIRFLSTSFDFKTELFGRFCFRRVRGFCRQVEPLGRAFIVSAYGKGNGRGRAIRFLVARFLPFRRYRLYKPALRPFLALFR